MPPESGSVLPHLKTECRSYAGPVLGGFQTTTPASVNWKLDFLKRKYNYFWEFILTFYLFFLRGSVYVGWRKGDWKLVWLWMKWGKTAVLLCKAQYGWLNKSLHCSKSEFIVLYWLHMFKIKPSGLWVVLFVLWQGNYNSFPHQPHCASVNNLWIFVMYTKAARLGRILFIDRSDRGILEYFLIV